MSHINLIPGEQGVRLSTLSPKYLHTNSTSHTWPFSAVAELIDNAYDPDVDASQLWIDIERYGFEQCMTFTDNGAGMDSLKLHKMLSFGFCEKEAKNDHLPVGHYGNGFKSGSMRLGKDAIVFTKKLDSRSVGFLSQTYLETVKAQTILVPIVSWDSQEKMVERADGDKALQDILKYSLFKTKRDLLHQFDQIKSATGTRIIISRMRRTQEGKYEFDLRADYSDIRIPDDAEMENNKYKRQERQNHIPESDYSLRAYCSILYLRPRMQIILRGKKVRTTVIAKSLSKTEVDTYKPQGVSRPIKVTFGFSQNKNHYGIMMYHRNRLIKPYVRVGYQLRANNLGVGVIGVIQCDYLQPTHNKQDFDYTKAYRSSMSALGSKLNDYWNEKKGKAQANSNAIIPEPKEVESVPDQLWVQCDNPECLKWRKLPPELKKENLPEKWYCRDHPEKKWRSCDVPEELEDDQEQVVQPYVKKQKKRLEKELEEKKRKEREAKRIKELELEIRKKELQKKEAEISRLMQQVQAKSNQQKSAIQQKSNVKPEAQSPQKLQIKVVGSVVPRQATTTTTTTPKKVIVQQTSSSSIVLTPVSTPVTPGQTLTIKTPGTTSVTRQIVQNPQMVVVQGNVTPNRPIFQKPATVTTVTPQQGAKIVNIISKGTATPAGSKSNPVVMVNTGKVAIAQPTAVHPKVSGPPVILKVSSQAAAEQVKYLPTMVPVAAVVEPKVVSVQSLAKPNLSVATSQTSNILIKPVGTPTNTNIQSPTLPVPSNLTGKTPGRKDISSTQTLAQTPTAQVKSEPQTLNTAVATQTGVKTEQQNSSSPNVSKLKRPHDQSTSADEPVARKPRPDTDIIIIDPPSPPPMRSISPVMDKVKEELDNSNQNAEKTEVNQDVPDIDTSIPDMDTMPEEDTSMAEVNGEKPEVKKNVPEIDAVIPKCDMDTIDKDVLDDVKSMSPGQQLQALLNRTQQLKQLYALRANVSKLLRVLVPELEVEDLKDKYHDQTVDNLLQQVLEQAEKADQENDS